MKDIRSEVQDAIDRQDQAAIAKERIRWRQKAKRVFSELAQSPATEPKRKRHREKCYEWLTATDHQLWCCTGRRWDDFCHAPTDGARADPGGPELWDTVTVSIDQGSDGWGALMFLMYHRQASVMCIKDPSHRMWRDVWLGLAGAQLKPLMVLASIVLNLDHGPWGDSRWYQSSREAAAAYLRVGGPDDALFQRHLNDIAQEVGLEHRLTEPQVAQELFDSIPEALNRMSTKVAQSRWFGLFHNLEEFLPWWSRRYVVLAYLGLHQGLYEATGMPLMTRMSARSHATEPAEEGPTRREGLDIQTLKRSCHNTLHLACVFLGDPDIRDLARGICLVVGPLRAEFQAVHKALRS